jgi:hypothetical protein
LLHHSGLARALDCDALFSRVDRPRPRHLLNAFARAHLIPDKDGGILARIDRHGELLHVDWRIQTIRPGSSLRGLPRRAGVGRCLPRREGKLDDPEYVKGLRPEFTPLLARQNVFPFSLSVAAHEMLQMLGLVTGEPRIGGTGAQTYHGYPGLMELFPGPLMHSALLPQPAAG